MSDVNIISWQIDHQQTFDPSDLHIHLETIHECVIQSTIRHVVSYPTSILIRYLTTYPFFRGADILYYLLLRKVGSEAYYAEDGNHVIHIQPELAYVYVLAEQDIKVPIHKDNPSSTIYSQIRRVISRISSCDRFRFRHSIITEDADFETAIQIPTLALNLPTYQAYFRNPVSSEVIAHLLINHDCLEPIRTLDKSIIELIIKRSSVMKATAPTFWQHHLQQYYVKHLQRLQIHNLFQTLYTRQIYRLNQLFPELIRMPPNLSALATRLWFSDRPVRAYLLGFDITDGIPSDEIISKALRELSQSGVEQYVKEITGIYLDTERHLTGQIGINYYPHLAGKKLINTRDSFGISIGSYYSYDIVPISIDDSILFISLHEIVMKIDRYVEHHLEYLQTFFVENKFHDLTLHPSDQELEIIRNRLLLYFGTLPFIPARIRLVEISSHDIIDYMK
jgi:hypothetical protein